VRTRIELRRLLSWTKAAERSRRSHWCTIPTSFGAELDQRDVVVLGLDEHVRTLGLATGELLAGRLQTASAPLDEREELPLSVALKCAGECAGPRRRHVPRDASRAGRSAGGSIGCVPAGDDRLTCFDDHRVLTWRLGSSISCVLLLSKPASLS
jgi:hypothetical protein